RQEERRSGDELRAVEIAAPRSRRRRGVDARLRRGHSENAGERPQFDLAAVLVAPDPAVGVELPGEHPRLAGADAEALVQRRRPAAAESGPVRPDANLVDAYDERLACAGAAHLDGTDQGVAVVELGIARLEAARLA